MKPDLYVASLPLMVAICLSVCICKDGFAQEIRDMRLFYTPSERAALPPHTDTGVAAAIAEQDPQRTDQVETSSPSTPVAKREKATNTAADTTVVTFNALVSGRNGFSIVLNGLSCKPSLSTVMQTSAARDFKVSQSCPHLEKREFKFVVNTRKRSLTVMHEGRLLGILGVGDSL